MSEQPPYFEPPQQGPQGQPGQPGYGPPPSSGYAGGPYGPPPEYGGWAMGAQPSGPPAWWGPPGRMRKTGTSILLAIVTLGIYVFVYNYSVHDEMKRHSGRGIGGGIALLLTFLANVAMPFITPAEIANLYRMRGWREPVNGWTGLWFVVPAIAGNIFFFVVQFAAISTNSAFNQNFHPNFNSGTTSLNVGLLVVAVVVYIGAVIGGGVIWFVKTNTALNTYWQSVQPVQSAGPAAPVQPSR